MANSPVIFVRIRRETAKREALKVDQLESEPENALFIDKPNLHKRIKNARRSRRFVSRPITLKF